MAKSPGQKSGRKGATRSKRGNAQRREQTIVDALRATVRDLFRDTHGAGAPTGKPWILDLRFRVQSEGNWDLEFVPDITSQLKPQLATAHADWNAYIEGRVYCFECLTSQCRHSAPRSSRQAFFGYGPTGRPIWREFGQILIDRHDEQAERLFANPPELCTVIQDTNALRKKQLSAFGRESKTYAVLGQLSAGYFMLDAWDPQVHEDDRFALTWQVVEARDHEGRISLHLNTLGTVPGCSSLAELKAGNQFDWVQRAQTQAQTQLERVHIPKSSAQSTDPGTTISDRALACLRTLASALKQGQRQRRRRTRHAQRRRAVQRPVHKAIDDVINAPAERFFMDLKHHSLAILGPHGRCHVFADDGKHITSFTITRDAVQNRLRKKRWVELGSREKTQFLANFHQQSGTAQEV